MSKTFSIRATTPTSTTTFDRSNQRHPGGVFGLNGPHREHGLARACVDVAPHQWRVLFAQRLEAPAGVIEDEAGPFGRFEQRPAPYPAAAGHVLADDGAQQPPAGVVVHAPHIAGGIGHAQEIDVHRRASRRV